METFTATAFVNAVPQIFDFPVSGDETRLMRDIDEKQKIARFDIWQRASVPSCGMHESIDAIIECAPCARFLATA